MWTKEGRLSTHEIMTKQKTFNHLKVRLAKALTGTADADKTLADITECDFPGYAEIADPAWDAPALNGSDQAEGKSTLLTWTAGTIVTPQTILAVYLVFVDTFAVEKLLWIKQLSPTVTIGATGEVFERYVDLFVDDIAAYD